MVAKTGLTVSVFIRAFLCKLLYQFLKKEVQQWITRKNEQVFRYNYLQLLLGTLQLEMSCISKDLLKLSCSMIHLCTENKTHFLRILMKAHDCSCQIENHTTTTEYKLKRTTMQYSTQKKLSAQLQHRSCCSHSGLLNSQIKVSWMY